MSVEIYNITDTESNICVSVSGEHIFNTIWAEALKQLHILERV